MGVQEQVGRLLGLRSDLADNLTKMGVPSSPGETLAQLVPKVLRILQGDPSKEIFVAALAGEVPGATYGFFSFGEAVQPAQAITLSALCRIETLRLTLSVTLGSLDTLEVTAPGWTVSAGVLTYQLGSGATRFDALTALEAVSLTSRDKLILSVSLDAVGEDGTALSATGSTKIQWSGATWVLIEDKQLTWQSIEDANMDWTDLEGLKK